MNLIANTGIQYLTVSLEINSNHNDIMDFHEWFDTKDSKPKMKMEIAHCFSDEEVWVKKRDLKTLDCVKDGKVVVENENGDYVQAQWEDIKKVCIDNGIEPIPIETDDPIDSGCFQQSINGIAWDKFQNKWLPFPFFSIRNNGQSEFGPTNWCRFKMIPAETTGKTKKFHLLFAFDTRTTFEKEDFEDGNLMETPFFASTYETSKNYAPCNNEFWLVDYTSETKNCEWVNEHILKIFNIERIERQRMPKFGYLAQYILLVRYIQQRGNLPQITLFSNNTGYGNVDLVVDIGNSRTCALLFDDSKFDKCSPLELQDFSSPIIVDKLNKYVGKLNKYVDSFDMRLAFREADFGGRFGIDNSRQFVYPSMVRLGKEANRLIYEATNLNTGAEKTSTFSSPKRYLWDTKPQKQEWEFVQLKDEKTKPINITGISEQLSSDGSLNVDGSGGILTRYSRKALMTFAFLEILAQAKMQINSYEQRKHWGSPKKPRQIGRIIITCPTAMSKVEQIALRKCAEDAAIILDRFFEDTYYTEINERVRANIRVVPSVRNLSNRAERTEWIYDEATCAQFVFLYAEIGDRYMRNAEEYFNYYGKLRDDLDDYNKKSLTIGSVDIGAGTTDVMIAAYKYDDAGQCTLTPVPLFWESFYLAGDDLLKELVKQLVIEGEYSPIEKKLRSLGKTTAQIVDMNNDFFGGNVGMSVQNRQLRSEFNLQVSVPIVLRYLEMLQRNEESITLSFSDIFSEQPPTQHVLDHFKDEQNFGFDFEELNWDYDKKIVSDIVEKTFDILIGKISSAFSYYGCDIVLLSGRPTSLQPLADLFLDYYAISPNRMKTMNNYRVGDWFPEDKRYKFKDGSGNLINPKSFVATGAMIGNCASTQGKLKGFSLNLKELAEKLTPTTDFFGKLNEETLEFIETNISPDKNSEIVEVSSLPLRIGCRQFDTPSYPSRPFYTLDFNFEKIENKVREKINDEKNVREIQAAVDNEISKICKKMPLQITIGRDYDTDKEWLRIVSVTSQMGESLPANSFNLQVQSMSEPDNFWLDSGIFNLNINNLRK